MHRIGELTSPIYFKIGDEGSRTPVQNGSKQTSTSVDINSLGLFREYQNLYKQSKVFFTETLTFNGCLDASTVINALPLA